MEELERLLDQIIDKFEFIAMPSEIEPRQEGDVFHKAIVVKEIMDSRKALQGTGSEGIFRQETA